MKKLALISTIIIAFCATAKAQVRWEFNYFALEIGMHHNFAGAPDTLKNLVVKTDAGSIPVYPIKNVEYTPGYTIGLQFHHDFNNDKSGIVFGVTYSSYAAASRYSSADKSLELAKSEFDKFTQPEATYIFVTNEIGSGGVSDNVLQRQFTDLQGWMNQYIAARADEVFLMVSGIAVEVKSEK